MLKFESIRKIERKILCVRQIKRSESVGVILDIFARSTLKFDAWFHAKDISEPEFFFAADSSAVAADAIFCFYYFYTHSIAMEAFLFLFLHWHQNIPKIDLAYPKKSTMYSYVYFIIWFRLRKIPGLNNAFIGPFSYLFLPPIFLPLFPLIAQLSQISFICTVYIVCVNGHFKMVGLFI